MPFCVKCGAIVKESDNFCMKCGTARQSSILQDTNNGFFTAADLVRLEKMVETDEAFRIEFVEKYTCRTNVTSDDGLVEMLATNPLVRKSIVYGMVANKYVDNTKCSELPLDWKRWPNFILVENTFPAEMADNIAAFIKRTRDDNSLSNKYGLCLICADPSNSWAVLQEADNVLDYNDNIEDGIGEFFGLKMLCQIELEALSNNRLSNIDEYNKLFPDDYYFRHILIIDDYDTFIQSANDDRIQQDILPYLSTHAHRLGFYFIFCCRSGSRTLGNLKSIFTIKSASEFVDMCKGEYSTVNSTDMAVSGYDFEQLCASTLRKNKYKNVEITKKSGDQGIDILAEKDGVKYAIQCKHYTSPVGNNAVQEAFAGKTFYGCHVAVVMTNSTFSDSARQLANQLGVVLWDGDFVSELQKEDE